MVVSLPYQKEVLHQLTSPDSINDASLTSQHIKSRSVFCTSALRVRTWTMRPSMILTLLMTVPKLLYRMISVEDAPLAACTRLSKARKESSD